VVRKNQAITLEDLNVSGMVKNRQLSQAISLQGWREFRTLCDQKDVELIVDLLKEESKMIVALINKVIKMINKYPIANKTLQ
jgi:hypothetical protein